MDFIGSKKKWGDIIYNIICSKVNYPFEYTLIDSCAGSGFMSVLALKNNFNVITNDNMYFSPIITSGQILPKRKIKTVLNHIKIINSLNGVEGFFYTNFWLKDRLYFSKDNTKKIDACREYIETINDTDVKNTLLFLSIEALSRVSNTTGVQAAYLKKFKERAKQPFTLRFETDKIFISNEKIKIYNDDLNTLINKIKTKKSILYIDPPYNNRQYPPNYHLYETFVRYDNPELKGKTGLRKDWISESGSKLCNKKGFEDSMKQIISNSSSDYIFISYNTDGLFSEDDFKKMFKSLNVNYKLYKWKTIRYKSDCSKSRSYNSKDLYELLYEVQK